MAMLRITRYLSRTIENEVIRRRVPFQRYTLSGKTTCNRPEGLENDKKAARFLVPAFRICVPGQKVSAAWRDFGADGAGVIEKREKGASK
jgi:hypothetical protein